MKRAIHVILVGDAPVSSITPCLDPVFAPGQAILLTPPDRRSEAGWLESVLTPRGIRCSRWAIDEPYGIERIRERVFDLLAEREADADAGRLALNATGGTRPMALAAYEVFRQLEQPVFYVNPLTDHLQWLYHPEHPDGAPSTDLADRIKLSGFMSAHGARIESSGPARGVPKALRALCDDLVAHAEQLARPIATLNYLSSTAEGSLYSEEMGHGLRRAADLQALIDRFEAAGCLGRAGDRLVFPDEERRFFVCGGWLEAHVFGSVFGLRKQRPTLQDVGRGVQVARSVGGGEVRNEIDVAFLADNRLFVIECKTACLERGNAGSTALYKLDSIADVLGGARTQAMLVSFRPLEGYQQRRAEELGINVVSGGALRSLESRLLSWIPQSSAVGHASR